MNASGWLRLVKPRPGAPPTHTHTHTHTYTHIHTHTHTHTQRQTHTHTHTSVPDYYAEWCIPWSKDLQRHDVHRAYMIFAFHLPSTVACTAQAAQLTKQQLRLRGPRASNRFRKQCSHVGSEICQASPFAGDMGSTGIYLSLGIFEGPKPNHQPLS